MRRTAGLVSLIALLGATANGQDADAAAEMARKAQDPLGNVRAIMMDNTEDDFNVGTLQLIAIYNFPNSPGAYIGYNNAITFNW